MKVYYYFLKGTQVNGQYSAKPEYFKLRIFKYRAMVRIWRFQVVIDYNKLANKWKQK
jgi:hypothetical protein